MRGFDYRSPLLGLNLVIQKPFETHRHLQQGICRVGRYGERCTRLLVKGVQLIDKEAQLRYMTQLIAFANSLSRPKTVYSTIPHFAKKVVAAKSMEVPSNKGRSSTAIFL
jgi:hypothetical protein